MVKTSGEHLSDLTILCGTKEIRTFQAQFWILVDSSGPLGTLAFRFLDIFNHEPVFLRGGIWLEITKKNIFKIKNIPSLDLEIFRDASPNIEFSAWGRLQLFDGSSEY